MLSSGSMILLTITPELTMILQNICRRDVDSVLNNISTSNIFPFKLRYERFDQNCPVTFGLRFRLAQEISYPTDLVTTKCKFELKGQSVDFFIYFR